jgi:hypothetical protein
MACYLPDRPLQIINTAEFDNIKKRADALIHDKPQSSESHSP